MAVFLKTLIGISSSLEGRNEYSLGTMAATGTIYSRAVPIDYTNGVEIQWYWSGSNATASIGVDASNGLIQNLSNVGRNIVDARFSSSFVWTNVFHTGSGNTGGPNGETSGSFMLNMTGIHAKFLRAYTSTVAGSGTMTVTISGKGNQVGG